MPVLQLLLMGVMAILLGAVSPEFVEKTVKAASSRCSVST